jgi:hypothetical protein
VNAYYDNEAVPASGTGLKAHYPLYKTENHPKDDFPLGGVHKYQYKLLTGAIYFWTAGRSNTLR